MKASAQSEGQEVGDSAKDRRKTLVQQEIIDQACRIFARKGYDGTTLGDIAESMGMTRPAIYYYFRNKEAVLTALMDDITSSPLRDIAEWRSCVFVDSAGKLRDFVKLRVRSALSRQTQMRVIQIVEEALPPDLAQSHQEAKRRVLAEYRSIIREGIAAGAFRPQDDRVAALAVIGMINWTMYWAPADKPDQVDAIADQLAEFAVQALVSPRATRVPGEPLQMINTIREELDRLAAMLPKTESGA